VDRKFRPHLTSLLSLTLHTRSHVCACILASCG
jgi:hypothetical protein